MSLVLWLWLACAAGPGVAPVVDYCHTIEVNTFGETPRTALIYRDLDGSIVDWRWFTDKAMPQKVPGGYLAVWNDCGKLRSVRCDAIRYSRTREDRELAERSKLPEHKRRKLSR